MRVLLCLGWLPAEASNVPDQNSSLRQSLHRRECLRVFSFPIRSPSSGDELLRTGSWWHWFPYPIREGYLLPPTWTQPRSPWLETGKRYSRQTLVFEYQLPWAWSSSDNTSQSWVSLRSMGENSVLPTWRVIDKTPFVKWSHMICYSFIDTP